MVPTNIHNTNIQRHNMQKTLTKQPLALQNYVRVNLLKIKQMIICNTMLFKSKQTKLYKKETHRK